MTIFMSPGVHVYVPSDGLREIATRGLPTGQVSTSLGHPMQEHVVGAYVHCSCGLVGLPDGLVLLRVQQPAVLYHTCATSQVAAIGLCLAVMLHAFHHVHQL